MAVTVQFEVEYATDSEERAREYAEAHALLLLARGEVDAVAAGLKQSRSDELPITERYLQDEPRQMDVDECIAEASGK